MPWAYTTVEQLMETVQVVEDNVSDLKRQRMLGIIEGVSEEIDRHTERSFRTYSGTLTFTPEFSDLLLIPDLLTLTTLKIDWDDDADHDFEVTLDGTDDYHLEPINAPQNQRPYTRIKIRPASYYHFPRRPRSVEIVGKWGYWERTLGTGVTLAAELSSSATEAEVSNIDAIQIGSTLLIGSEQIYVRDKNPITGKLVIERGQNGTTAALQADASSISRYVYPNALATAALLQAARIFRRSETPLGIVNNPGDIGWRAVYIPKLDLDVQRLLRVFVKRNVL